MSEGADLRSAGKYLAALPAFQHALDIAEGSATSDPGRFIQTLDSLAAVFVEAGQVANAEREYRRALAFLEAAQQEHSLAYAELLASLASISDDVGNEEKTLTTLRKAIALYGRGSPSRSVFTLRECLAEILIKRHEYSEAETLLLDARAEIGAQKQVDPLRLSTALNNLAQLHYLQGRLDEALTLYLQSTSTLRSALGDQNPSLIPSLNNLALTYLQMSRFADADEIFRQSATLCGRVLGNHPTCGDIDENYALALRKIGRKREARKWLAQSRQIMEDFRRRNGVGLTVSITALR